jgi:hypothetical protein
MSTAGRRSVGPAGQRSPAWGRATRRPRDDDRTKPQAEGLQEVMHVWSQASCRPPACLFGGLLAGATGNHGIPQPWANGPPDAGEDARAPRGRPANSTAGEGVESVRCRRLIEPATTVLGRNQVVATSTRAQPEACRATGGQAYPKWLGTPRGCRSGDRRSRDKMPSWGSALPGGAPPIARLGEPTARWLRRRSCRRGGRRARRGR